MAQDQDNTLTFSKLMRKIKVGDLLLLDEQWVMLVTKIYKAGLYVRIQQKNGSVHSVQYRKRELRRDVEKGRISKLT